MSVLEHQGPWHFDELADLPETGERCEVVDGNLVVTPPPTFQHQLVSNRLCQALARTAPDGWDVLMECPLPLGTDGRVPDVAVVRREAPRGPGPYPAGPEFFGLVIEVVSPRSRKTDWFLKPAEYAEAGINLYWRVELEPEITVSGFELRDGAYVPCEPKAPWGSVSLDLPALLS